MTTTSRLTRSAASAGNFFAKSPSIFDCYIRSLSESRFAQTLMKCGQHVHPHDNRMSDILSRREDTYV